MAKLDWLLGRTQNPMGPMSADVRTRIEAYHDNPTPDGWDDIAPIIVCTRPMTTIWQAVRFVDHKFPATGRAYDAKGNMLEDWSRIPAAFTVLRAIDEATKQTA